jgi:hypothetical protein
MRRNNSCQYEKDFFNEILDSAPVLATSTLPIYLLSTRVICLTLGPQYIFFPALKTSGLLNVFLAPSPQTKV